MKNQDGICVLWDLEFGILIMQPSHSYTLAYCRPIHLISIEFQNIYDDLGSSKKAFFFPSIVLILQFVQSLWLRFYLQTISTIRYKILWLEVKKDHFIWIIGLHVNKYIYHAFYSLKWPWNFRGKNRDAIWIFEKKSAIILHS